MSVPEVFFIFKLCSKNLKEGWEDEPISVIYRPRRSYHQPDPVLVTSVQASLGFAVISGTDRLGFSTRVDRLAFTEQ